MGLASPKASFFAALSLRNSRPLVLERAHEDVTANDSMCVCSVEAQVGKKAYALAAANGRAEYLYGPGLVSSTASNAGDAGCCDGRLTGSAC